MNYAAPSGAANNALGALFGKLTIRVITPMIDVRAVPMGVSMSAMKATSVQIIRCTHDDATRIVAAFRDTVGNSGEYTYEWVLNPVPF